MHELSDKRYPPIEKVAYTVSLKSNNTLRGYLCSVLDVSGDDYLVHIGLNLNPLSCTCPGNLEDDDIGWYSCPHMDYMYAPEGYTQGFFRNRGEIKAHVIKLTCEKVHAIDIELDGTVRRDASFYYHLTLREGTTKQEKDKITELGRALRSAKKQGGYGMTDAISGTRLDWVLLEYPLREFHEYFEFERPLADLMKEAREAYAQKIKSEWSERWAYYQEHKEEIDERARERAEFNARFSSGEFFSLFNQVSQTDQALREFKLSSTATKEEIIKRWRELAKQHHPDTGGDAETFKRLNSANEILMKWKTA